MPPYKQNLPKGLGFIPFCLPCPVECGAYSSGVSEKELGKIIRELVPGEIPRSGATKGSIPLGKLE